MKKVFLIFFLLITSFCFAEPKNSTIMYERYDIKSSYNYALTDSICLYELLVNNNKLYNLVVTTYDSEKNLETSYALYSENLDKIKNLLFEIIDFNKSIKVPSFKDYLAIKVKDDNKFEKTGEELFTLIDVLRKQFYYTVK